MPPLKRLHTIPVPPPTLPSATRPPRALSSAAQASCFVTWKPLMSLRPPSHVSATTGSDHSSCCMRPWRTTHSITASRTTPTEWVLVIITGPHRNPDSSTQVVPVISPLPFMANQPANTGSSEALPRGKIAVTPVRTGPLPTTRLPAPAMRVRCPTSTPATSVMAWSGPSVPSSGIPRSRARSRRCARAAWSVRGAAPPALRRHAPRDAAPAPRGAWRRRAGGAAPELSCSRSVRVGYDNRLFESAASRATPCDRFVDPMTASFSAPSSYWQTSRAPRYSLLFALPLLLFYQVLAVVLAHGTRSVRNGADVILQSLFVAVAGSWGPLVFMVCLIAVGLWLVARDLRKSSRLRVSVFCGMLAEAELLALLFGFLVGGVTNGVLGGLQILARPARRS